MCSAFPWCVLIELSLLYDESLSIEHHCKSLLFLLPVFGFSYLNSLLVVLNFIIARKISNILSILKGFLVFLTDEKNLFSMSRMLPLFGAVVKFSDFCVCCLIWNKLYSSAGNMLAFVIVKFTHGLMHSTIAY